MYYRGKFIGFLFTKKRWLSLCSAHGEYKKDCKLCNAGHYANVWQLKIENGVYWLSPKLWKKLITIMKWGIN